MVKKVVLGMSGGVDSSVAALLLARQGYEVYGYFMSACPSGKSIWPSSIKWKDEEKLVRKICRIVGVKKLYVIDCERGYEEKIIKKMFKDYSLGRTPNPDILCNNVGKFPGLVKKAKEIGADWIATGHYARTRPPTKNVSKEISAGGRGGERLRGGNDVELLMGKDREKDQSYFLVGLGQNILKKCLFPVGDLTKTEVRKIAKKAGFPNWDKHGSRGICYLGKIDMKKFLHSRIKEKKGRVVDCDGNVVGTHCGVMFFTIGERVRGVKGLDIDESYRRKIKHKRLFIAEKRKGNVLVIAPKGDKSLRKKKVMIKGMKFIGKEEKGRMKGRIRHLGSLEGGELKKEKYYGNKSLLTVTSDIVKNNSRHVTRSTGEGGESRRGGKKDWVFVFDKGVEGVAEGQFIVLYDRDRVVGGGEIRLE